MSNKEVSELVSIHKGTKVINEYQRNKGIGGSAMVRGSERWLSEQES